MLIGVAMVALPAPLVNIRHLVAQMPCTIGTSELYSLAALGAQLVTVDAGPVVHYTSGSSLRHGCTCRTSAFGAGSTTPSAAPRAEEARETNMTNMNAVAMGTMTRVPTVPAAAVPTRRWPLHPAQTVMGDLDPPATGFSTTCSGLAQFGGAAVRLGRAARVSAAASTSTCFTTAHCTQFKGDIIRLGPRPTMAAAASARGSPRAIRNCGDLSATTPRGSPLSARAPMSSPALSAPPSVWRPCGDALPRSALVSHLHAAPTPTGRRRHTPLRGRPATHSRDHPTKLEGS